jgi:hypothetical protein
MLIFDYIHDYEFRCSCCGKFPPDLYDENGEITPYYLLLFKLFVLWREAWGKAINITSGWRCSHHQLYLYMKGISTTPYSAHLFGALDCKFASKEEALRALDVLRRVVKENDMPMPRIGWKSYLGKTNHIHIDYAFIVCPRWDEKLKEGAEW